MYTEFFHRKGITKNKHKKAAWSTSPRFPLRHGRCNQSFISIFHGNQYRQAHSDLFAFLNNLPSVTVGISWHSPLPFMNDSCDERKVQKRFRN